MKQLYLYQKMIAVTRKDGVVVKIIGNKSNWHYGELPIDKVEVNKDIDNPFEKLCDIMGVKPSRSFLWSKKYLSDTTILWDWSIDGYVDEENILSFMVVTKYYIGDPSIKILQKELSFMEYTQLLFDREKDLKRLYESGDSDETSN